METADAGAKSRKRCSHRFGQIAPQILLFLSKYAKSDLEGYAATARTKARRRMVRDTHATMDSRHNGEPSAAPAQFTECYVTDTDQSITHLSAHRWAP